MIPRPTTITEECSCGATFKVTSHLAIGAAGDWRRNHKCREAVQAEATLARVKAMTDERDVFYPPKFEPTPSQNYVRGWRDLQRKIRTVLDEDGAQ